MNTPTSFAAESRPRDLVMIATQLPRQDSRPDLFKDAMIDEVMRLLSAQVGGVLDVASPAAEGGTTVTLKLDRAPDCDRVPELVVRLTPAGGTEA